MANEFPKLSEVFKIGTEVTYDEAIEKVFLPQDNAVKSIPTISPIETVTLTENKIVPTAFLVQIQIVENLSNELHFIDYNNLRDGATLQLRILDNNNPIVIKNGINGVGSIMTADGNDIELNDYRTIVQLQLEGTLWRQVGGIQAQADWNQVDNKKPDFIKNKPTNLLDSTRITNCITEIPQDIKLELNNGTITLKAGSKVYNGNGLLATTSNDLQAAWATTGTAYISVTADQKSLYVVGYPGETVSSLPNPTTSYKLYYNTTDGKCYADEGSWREMSFPIAIISATGQISSIDQVFNGFGYIGSTVFALPGVKGLIPNGRNKDGSLKNDIFSVTNVTPITINSGPNGIKSIYFTTSGGIGITSSYTYDLQKNILLDTEDNSIINGCIAINFVWDNSQQVGQKITSFNPKLPFRVADDQETVHKSGDEEIGGDKTLTGKLIFKSGDNVLSMTQQADGNFVIYKNNVPIVATSNGILQAPNNSNATVSGSVVTTTGINKSDNGYVRLGNGIIIQWGYSNVDGGQITLPAPFTTINYRICATYMHNGSINNDYGHVCTYPLSTTSFYANTEAGWYQWIAIGY